MAIWYPGDYASLLLDSRLITGVRLEKYNYKIVRCGDYLQVYKYKDKKCKHKDNIEAIDKNNLRISKIRCNNNEHKILNRNIIRTKLDCQRLAKANAKDWTSFITLTYKDNMQDVKQSKLDLNYFIKNIKKKKKDFKYIAIPEFQKRGAIHFHILSNLSLEDKNIIVHQKDNDNYYDVKYWNKGFTSYENVTGDVKKIVGYISKYMTKECDERLFNFRRFSSSLNLERPQEDFLELNSKNKRLYLNALIKNRELIYANKYYDNYYNEVSFMEFCVK